MSNSSGNDASAEQTAQCSPGWVDPISVTCGLVVDGQRLARHQPYHFLLIGTHLSTLGRTTMTPADECDPHKGATLETMMNNQYHTQCNIQGNH